jgi:DNA processing protein
MTAGVGVFDPAGAARAALTYLAEPGDARLGAVVRACGPVEAFDAIKAGSLPAAAMRAAFGSSAPFGSGACGNGASGRNGASGTSASGTSGAARAAARRAMERWRIRLAEVPGPAGLDGFCRAGIRLACPGDAEWPSQLATLGDGQPYALWLRGAADLRFCCLRSVAIVGSRAATAYGAYVAAETAGSLAARGWAVISGGAYGIDAAAHRGALGADGVTIAVLACGVDHPYPAGHKELLDAIAAQGLVASEWPPGRTPTRLRFLVRNRVIAALATGTLVVEAGRRSGALNTARHARDLYRPLMAVPGPVTAHLSAGCHTIIREWHGTLVTSAADVIEFLSPAGTVAAQPLGGGTAAPGTGEPGTGQPGGVLQRDVLDLDSAAVLDALPVRGGAGPAKIATSAGLDLDTVMRCLGALAAGGFAERCARGWRVRRTRLLREEPRTRRS